MTNCDKTEKKDLNKPVILIAGDMGADILIHKDVNKQNSPRQAVYSAKSIVPLKISRHYGGVEQQAILLHQVLSEQEQNEKYDLCLYRDKTPFFHISQLKTVKSERKQPGGNPCGKQQLDNNSPDVIRVKRFLGFSEQDLNISTIGEDLESNQSIKDILDNKFNEKNNQDNLFLSANGVLIHDAGEKFTKKVNQFRKKRGRSETQKPKIILLKKISEIRGYESKSYLNHYLTENRQNLIIVTNLSVIRASGANISLGLSWEKTISDFLWQIEYNHTLAFLNQCAVLVVRIGFAGAIVYVPKSKDKTVNKTDIKPYVSLIYDPCALEGFFEERNPGEILAPTSIFTAFLFSDLLKLLNNNKKELNSLISEEPGKQKFFDCCFTSISHAIEILQYLHEQGYNLKKIPLPVYDLGPAIKKITNPTDPMKPKRKFARVGPHGCLNLEKIKEWDRANDPDDTWSILDENRTENVGAIAYAYVKYGRFQSPLNKQKVPVGNEVPPFPFYQMGGIKTVDRGEIESYQSIRKLFREYLRDLSNKNPLSIAVFGPPGSGKSFGITELAKEFKDQAIEPITFNLSQFCKIEELTCAFHRIRDNVLEGKVPLVFFDEFDSSFEKERLGWLKQFLVPMQDGKFIDGECMHPIGRAIFIFAGGIYQNFNEFNQLQDGGKGKESKNKEDIDYFRSIKGPDFLSRLRGYINVVGCNPVKKSQQYKITRAILLRKFLWDRSPELFEDNVCRIDRDVLRAFIKIDHYRHGNRSMRAIVEMSNLKGKKRFDPADLPPVNQLDLHVDASRFMHLVLRNVHYYEAKEAIVKDMLANFTQLLKIIYPSGIEEEEGQEKIIYEKFFHQIPAIFSLVNYSILKEPENKEGTDIDKDNYSIHKISEQVIGGDSFREMGVKNNDVIRLSEKKIDEIRERGLIASLELIDKEAHPESDKEMIYNFMGIYQKSRPTDQIIKDLQKLQDILAKEKLMLYPI